MRAPIRSHIVFGIVLACISITALGGIIRILRQGTTGADNSALSQRDSGVPLEVEARGRGRAWRFSYCGSDGILGSGDDVISTAQLKLPAGTNVVIQLRSDDFIYVFSCPDLNLKEIAVPDLAFSIAFRTDREGEYDLTMDAMCGFRLPPGKTMGSLSIVSESEWRCWLDELPQSH